MARKQAPRAVAAQLPHRRDRARLRRPAARGRVRQALRHGRLRHQSGPHRRAAGAARTARSRSTPKELRAAKRLRFTTELKDLEACSVFIVTVPTPIDAAKRPDLTPLERASETVGKVLKRGDIVIYESTVYPGLHRGNLRADPRARVGAQVQPGLLRRLQPRAHQPGRPRAPAADHPQGHLRLDAARRPSSSTRSTARSSRPARTRPPRSGSPRRPRSSRTRSATSTSR